VHEVKVALHPEVAVTVKINVARSPEEADLQAQGIDVLQQMFEEQAAPLVAEELAPAGDVADTVETAAEVAEETAAEGSAAEEAAAEEAAAEEESEQQG
jgi:large subunit ribosomal protein L9